MDFVESVNGVPIRLTLERWFHIVENHDDVVLQFPLKRFWVDYDDEADVLYISFRRPQKATNTITSEEGLLLRYQGKELVGITVLDASMHQ